MRTPTVSEHMTKSVFTIGAGQTLAAAHQMMRDHRVRHLPVLERGRLVGIVSQRDLYLLETIRGVDTADTLVEEAMTADPYVVPPSAALTDVLREMLAHRWGSAIVAEGSRVIGVFTAVDAMRLLLDTLEHPPSSGRRIFRGRRRAGAKTASAPPETGRGT